MSLTCITKMFISLYTYLIVPEPIVGQVQHMHHEYHLGSRIAIDKIECINYLLLSSI